MASEQTPLLGSSPTIDHTTTTTTPQPSLPPKPLATESSLTKFRVAIGINIDETHLADIEAARKGPRGLYKEIISIQRKLYAQFVAVEIVYYGVILIQILIGALLASLGSLPSLHPIAITILGISNTFAAGVLALLKGQGLPDRLRKDEYQMKRVQDFIEETEIRLAVAGEGVVTSEELDSIVEQVFDKYNSAKDTAEMNRTSSYAHQAERSDGALHGLDGSGDILGSVIRKNVVRNEQNGNSGKGKAKFVID